MAYLVLLAYSVVENTIAAMAADCEQQNVTVNKSRTVAGGMRRERDRAGGSSQASYHHLHIPLVHSLECCRMWRCHPCLLLSLSPVR